jgi:hypothetical protein
MQMNSMPANAKPENQLPEGLFKDPLKAQQLLANEYKPVVKEPDRSPTPTRHVTQRSTTPRSGKYSAERQLGGGQPANMQAARKLAANDSPKTEPTVMAGSLAPPDMSKLIATEFFKEDSFANILQSPDEEVKLNLKELESSPELCSAN